MEPNVYPDNMIIANEAGVAELPEDSGDLLTRAGHDVGSLQRGLEVLERLSKAHD